MKLHDDISFYFLLTLFIRPAFVNLCRFVLILATAFPLLTTPELIEPLLPLSIHVLESILNPRSIVRFVSSQTMSIHRVGPAFDFYVALRFIRVYVFTESAPVESGEESFLGIGVPVVTIDG